MVRKILFFGIGFGCVVASIVPPNALVAPHVLVSILSGICLSVGVFLVIFGAFTEVNPPNRRRIIRDGFDRIVDWPESGLIWVIPFWERLAEPFTLNWRVAQVEETPCVCRDGQQVFLTVCVFFVVDPANMRDALRQKLIDQLGSGEEAWRQQVERLLLADVSFLVQQRTYAQLISPEGWRTMRTELQRWLERQGRPLGITVEQVMITRIMPSAQIMDLQLAALRRQASAEFIQHTLMPALAALQAYTARPIDALPAIALLDRLSNHEINALGLNVFPTNGGTNHRSSPAIPLSFPAFTERQ